MAVDEPAHHVATDIGEAAGIGCASRAAQTRGDREPQAQRLAAYLQAGLLVPTEEEALTVRATRDALERLDANPGRLLA